MIYEIIGRWILVKKKLSVFLLLTILVCGIFTFSNNSYEVTQEIELKDDYHYTEFQTETILDFQGISYLTTKEYLHTPSGYLSDSSSVDRKKS